MTNCYGLLFLHAAPMEDNDTGILTFILGSLAALFVIGLTVTVMCIIVFLQWRKRR